MKTVWGRCIFPWMDGQTPYTDLLIQRRISPDLSRLNRCIVSEIKELLLAPKCNTFHTITDNRTEQNITERKTCFANTQHHDGRSTSHVRLLPGVEGTMARHTETVLPRKKIRWVSYSGIPLTLHTQSSKSIVCYLATRREKLFTNNNQQPTTATTTIPQFLSCLCLIEY
jgi:hypothetical protein